VFAGAGDTWNDDETTVGVSIPSDEPHTSRLTPTLEAGSGVLSGEVELEEMGVPIQAHWVGSATILAIVVSIVYSFYILKYGETPHSGHGGAE
jgi:hypothetical protein